MRIGDAIASDFRGLWVQETADGLSEWPKVADGEGSSVELLFSMGG